MATSLPSTCRWCQTRAMTFDGWTDAALDFYEGLEVDNSRAYWQSHKKVYDEEVREPMEALLAELCDEFGDAKLFRPHRDIRLSADKGAGGADRGRPASRHVDDAADRSHRPTVRPPAAEPSVRRARRGLHRRTRATPAPGECRVWRYSDDFASPPARGPTRWPPSTCSSARCGA